MHDRIRLALAAVGIAAVTLLASGHAIPFPNTSGHSPAQASHAAQTTPAPVAAEITVISEAPKVETPAIRAPRIRRTAGADVTAA